MTGIDVTVTDTANTILNAKRLPVNCMYWSTGMKETAHQPSANGTVLVTITSRPISRRSSAGSWRWMWNPEVNISMQSPSQ